MFNPSQADVRRFFCATHAKQQAGQPMEAIETLAALWIAEHPEYHTDLADADAAIARNYDETLLARIAEAREQGWCLVNQELEEGLISVAAPLKNRAGDTVAALNISGQANRTSAQVMREQLLPELLATAQAISRTLRTR